MLSVLAHGTSHPHRAAPSERTVHGAGEACREAADSAGQVLPVLSLNEKMQMIVLRGNSMIRNLSCEAAAMALRTAGKTRLARRQRTAGVARNVTWTGCAALCEGRVI